MATQEISTEDLAALFPPVHNDNLAGLLALIAGKQPADSDLTAIAALSTTEFGRSLLTQVNAAAAVATIGVLLPVDAHAEAAAATDWPTGPSVMRVIAASNWAGLGNAGVVTTDRDQVQAVQTFTVGSGTHAQRSLWRTWDSGTTTWRAWREAVSQDDVAAAVETVTTPAQDSISEADPLSSWPTVPYHMRVTAASDWAGLGVAGVVFGGGHTNRGIQWLAAGSGGAANRLFWRTWDQGGPAWRAWREAGVSVLDTDTHTEDAPITDYPPVSIMRVTATENWAGLGVGGTVQTVFTGHSGIQWFAPSGGQPAQAGAVVYRTWSLEPAQWRDWFELVTSRQSLQQLEVRGSTRDRAYTDHSIRRQAAYCVLDDATETIESSDTSPRAVETIDGEVWGWTTNPNTIHKTASLKTEDWQVHGDAPADTLIRMLPTDDGEMLALTRNELYKSTGFAAGGTITWTQKLATGAGAVFNEWSIEGAGDTFICASRRVPIDDTNATENYVWVSLDEGDTWVVQHDRAQVSPDDWEWTHYHGVGWDPTDERFWFVEGHKETQGLLWLDLADVSAADTDDAGWTYIADPDFHDPVAFGTPDWGPTTLTSCAAGIVCGSDSQEVGLYIVRRETDPADYEAEWLWRRDNRLSGVSAVARRGWLEPDTGLVYVCFQGNLDHHFLVATDGFGGALVWESEEVAPSPSGYSFRNFAVLKEGDVRYLAGWINDVVTEPVRVRGVLRPPGLLVKADAIPDPDGGATVDAEARETIASLLGLLREQGVITEA